MAFSFIRLPMKSQLHHSLQLCLKYSNGSCPGEQILYKSSPKFVSLSAFLGQKEYSRPSLEFIDQRYSTSGNNSSRSSPFNEYSSKSLCPLNLQYDRGMLIRFYSTSGDSKRSLDDGKALISETKSDKENSGRVLTKTELLKKAIKEYGSTIVIFHISISLMSLGICYLAVTSGLNIQSFMPSSLGSSEISAEAGMFIVAYALHRVLAPVRISITLFTVPFLVRYLRKINILKP